MYLLYPAILVNRSDVPVQTEIAKKLFPQHEFKKRYYQYHEKILVIVITEHSSKKSYLKYEIKEFY